ncbi:MAG TPA: glycoside hydrolase family 3 C-terminal domain-containing protein, partial [Polyangiaceae bacterium]|nr:glycoside hydrolase family 3 C-terminal domain-containing protein [Polyangiaceae bacterium]
YGECPYLTARLGVAFCEGLQGDDPVYFKVIATPKHFAVHSGPEGQRHSFNAEVSPKDLWETYLPAFEACITEARAYSIMGAYNRTNGEACCASQRLLVDILRGQWEFDGFVVSDCWALRDLHEQHHVTRTWEESAALAVKMGCDLNCGCTYEHLPNAVAQGLVSEPEIDVCLTRLFLARMRLGLLDAQAGVPYADTPYELNDCAEHQALSQATGAASLVLLKNEHGLLPLPRDLGAVAVIGPNAHDAHVLRANYFGDPSRTVTPLQGIQNAVGPTTRVFYTQGCKHTGLIENGLGRSGNLSEAVSVTARADVAILCLGLNADIEGEQGDAGNSEASGDKADLKLTGLQEKLLRQVVAVGKPVVLVVLAGSPVDLTWAQDHVSAIIYAWYPGALGGSALAQVLFGEVSPAGRLPVTFPKTTADLPDFCDYSMQGRTYRYATATPLYPFGYGLSYAQFTYHNLQCSPGELTDPQATVRVSCTVTNESQLASDEVVQLYIHRRDTACPTPVFDLRGFERIHLAPKQAMVVEFSIDARALSWVDEAGQRTLAPGIIDLYVGGQQPDARSAALTGRQPLHTELRVSITLP